MRSTRRRSRAGIAGPSALSSGPSLPGERLADQRKKRDCLVEVPEGEIDVDEFGDAGPMAVDL